MCVLPGKTSSLGLTLPYPGLGLIASVSVSHLNTLLLKVLSLFLTKQPWCQTTQDMAHNLIIPFYLTSELKVDFQ